MAEERLTKDNAPKEIQDLFLSPYELVKKAQDVLDHTWVIADVGCGEGIGTKLVGGVGFDVEIPSEDVPFWKMDLRKPIKIGSWEVVLFLQTIEHLDREHHVRVLRELLGCTSWALILGTVNSEMNPFALGPEIYVGEKNKFHKWEYNRQRFQALTRSVPEGWEVELYSQLAEREGEVPTGKTFFAKGLLDFAVCFFMVVWKGYPSFTFFDAEVKKG